MKLIYLEVYRYERWMLSNIKKLTMTLKENLQLILGTNGSGKSSFLQLALPTSPESSEFGFNGYRIARWEHDGRVYEIKNFYPEKGSPTHSFKVNGVELNEGETGKVQSDLIAQHLKMDKDLHNLLTGNLRFTDMSVAQRKDWFRRISPFDIDLLFDLYKNVEKEARDRKGFVVSTDKILSELHTELEEITEANKDIETKIKSVKTDMESIREITDHYSTGKAKNIDELDYKIRSVIDQINELTDSVMRAEYPSKEFTSVTNLSSDDIAQSISDLESEAKVKESNYQHLVEELNALNARLENADLDLLLQTEIRYSECKKTLTKLDKELEKSIAIDIADSPSEILTCLKNIKEDFLTLVSNIPDDSSDLNLDELKHHQSRYDAYQANILEMDRKIHDADKLLYHFETSHSADCPKCKFRFKPGFEEVDIQQYRDDLDNYVEAKENWIKLLKETESEIERQEHYKELRASIVQILSYHPGLSKFRSYIMDDSVFRDQPRSIHDIFDSYFKKIEIARNSDIVKSELSKIEPLLDGLRNIHNSDLNSAKEHQCALTEKIENTLAYLTDIRLKIRYSKSVLREVCFYEEAKERLFNLNAELQELLSSKVISLLNKECKDSWSLLEDRLSSFNTIAGNMQTKRVLIAEHKKNRDKAKDENESLRLLADSLSPNGGLISDLLSSSIGSIMHQMNRVISAVWTHDFHLLDKTDSEVKDWLKYKFPFTIDNNERHVPDVANGSSAQKDIINFAFTLVVYTYLDLKDYPLFLDELGKTFDEQHRTRIMGYIKLCLDSQMFSQVFMISHYATQYGHLIGNSEALVLNTDNIIPPPSYNEHVTLEQ